MADRFGYGEIGLDINPCRGCDDYDAPDGCKSNGGCGKPITNGDRIRAMSNEELAEWIVHTTEGNGFDGYEEMVNAWLKWLKMEKDDADS